MEIAEDREYSHAPPQKIRTDFCQKHVSNTDWMLHVWDNGANTTALLGQRCLRYLLYLMPQISSLAENPSLNQGNEGERNHQNSIPLGLDCFGMEKSKLLSRSHKIWR